MGYYSALGSLFTKALPHLGRAAGTAAGFALGGRTISEAAKATQRDEDGKLKDTGFASFLGVTPDRIAEGETYDPEKDRITGWDGGDTARSWITGVSKEDAEAAARQTFQEDMTVYGNRRNRNQGRRLSALGIDGTQALTYDIEGREGKKGFSDRLDERGALISKLEELKALGGDITGFNMDSSAASVQSAIDRARNTRDLNTPGTQAWTAQQGLQLQQQQANQNAYQFQVQQQQLAAQERNRNAQLDADRELRRAEAGDRMELAMLERQGQREELRYRREERAENRRRESMMMLMKGMAQLGAGFAL